MVVGRHLEYFNYFKSYIQENITQHERPCLKQTNKILTCYIIRFDENFNNTVIQDGGQTPSWITRACHICQSAPMDFLNTDSIPVPMTYNTSSNH